MKELAHKQHKAERRALRVRATIHGTSERPRLIARLSNLHVSAQIIDDASGKTLVSATTVGQKLEGTMTDKAAVVGKQIAAKAKGAKVGKVVFDRGPHKYHGRIKALADAARQEGLEF